MLAIASLAAIAYLGACFALWKWQHTLIFLPTAEIETLPHELGLAYEDVWLVVQDDSRERLHGWWLPVVEPQKTILFLHGNGGNVGSNLEQAKIFHQLNLNVLLIDYRGYGRSQGREFPHEQQAYEDARVALDYLIADRRLELTEIVVFGHSLGGAIAIELARHNPQLAGLIVQSSFTSMQAMVDRDGIYNKWFPVNLLLHQRFDSLAKLPELKLPILFTHGSQDERISDQMSRELYAAANEPKVFYLIPEAGHNNIAKVGGSAYQAELARFLELIRDRQTRVAPF